MTSTALLQARDVHHAFGDVHALRGASLEVARGECVALVGESGSGKTTLLRCFNALVTPDAGDLRVRGEAIEAIDPVALRRSLGYVPQRGGLLPHWRVARNVALVPRLTGAPDPEAAAEVALARTGLPPAEYGDRWPRSLSGGQRQRVALARALAVEPDIILMDEPLGALDALARAELRRELGEVIRSSGTTVLLVTHDLEEAAILSDRIAVMKEGRILQVAPLEELRAHPADPYVTDLLSRGLPGRRG
ncbi:MAG: ATP-binding cassette domain-containing protein [Longimicrobiales bacterium]|nr:ATP-binding cassette domain-containing protein [Longimicrobiales bacterium]